MVSTSEPFPAWANLLMAASVLFCVGITWVITVRAADGRLGLNTMAGMRTRATMASPEAWQAGHVAALAVLRRAVPVTMLIWVVGVVFAFVQPAFGFFILLASLLAFLVWMWPLMRAANRAAKATDR